MESIDIFTELDKSIKQLEEYQTSLLGANQENSTEIEKKVSILILRIVGCFDEILSNKYIPNKEETGNLPENKNNKNYYWDFISKHFNTPVSKFCRTFENGKINSKMNPDHQKGKNWINFSILEMSFCDSIKQMYEQKLFLKFYDKDSILIRDKNEILNILNKLEKIYFKNISNNDYDKYLDYLKSNNKNQTKEEDNSDFDSKSSQTDFFNKEFKLSSISKINECHFNPNFINMSKISNVYPSGTFIDENDCNNLFPFYEKKKENIEEPKIEEKIDQKLNFKKYSDFGPNIIDNFYTFIFNKESSKKLKINKNENENENELLNDEQNSKNLNSINEVSNEEDNSSSRKNDEEDNKNEGLFLNPKKVNYLPIDNLYIIKVKTSQKEYTQDDTLIYDHKKITISNCLLLYLNKYYKKVPYHKFCKRNLHNKPITIKQQNYQCYICLKRFSFIFDIPIEEIFWCSYYMRFVCKNCIESEYSIIPHFVIKKWCFDKFSISKKAKNKLLKWYKKPVIFFRENDKIISKIPQFRKVIEIKKTINNIFNIMKCKNKFKFLEETMGHYDYLVLEELLFSLQDLVEINNKSFYKKMIEYKKLFIKHISGECPDCKFDGQTCAFCRSEEKIFFYNTDNIYYCKNCHTSLHKRCLGILGHSCPK